MPQPALRIGHGPAETGGWEPAAVLQLGLPAYALDIEARGAAAGADRAGARLGDFVEAQPGNVTVGCYEKSRSPITWSVFPTWPCKNVHSRWQKIGSFDLSMPIYEEPFSWTVR